MFYLCSKPPNLAYAVEYISAVDSAYVVKCLDILTQINNIKGMSMRILCHHSRWGRLSVVYLVYTPGQELHNQTQTQNADYILCSMHAAWLH